jgi:branched-subunit amino acid aminotransferase/4-amino-4-deoxychorismate lyase
MPEPQAFVNGSFVPSSEAVVPAFDAGFVQGTTVAEQLRTFGGRLFRLEMHVERLFHSLSIVEVDPGYSAAELARTATELAERNHALLAEGDDLGLAMLVTPGDYLAMAGDAAAQKARVVLHTFPLRFGAWASKYEQGERLATTDIVQVPAACWPPELKCRSRMHYYLADRQARKRFPGSRALLLDEKGYVVEASTANIVLHRRDTGLLLPPAHKILPGISLAVLHEIAEDLEIYSVERDLKPTDVAEADEVFLTSTSPCIVPVVSIDGRPIGAGRPGPMFARFMSSWNELVGLDVIAQARRFAERS